MAKLPAIGFYPREHWDLFNEELRQDLHLAKDFSVSVRGELGPTLFEICLELSHLYAHKRKIGLIRGSSPWVERIRKYFLQASYQVEDLDPQALPETGKEFVFVLGFDDHCVTGELQNLVGLESWCEQHKVFCIRASHQNWKHQKPQLKTFSILIGLLQNHSLVFGGLRFKSNFIWSGFGHFNFAEIKKQIAQIGFQNLDAQKIKDFENQFPAYQFVHSENRLWDRAVLSFPKISGEFVIQHLNAQTASEDFWTAQNCFWGSVTLWKDWWIPQIKVDVLNNDSVQSLIILPHQKLSADLAIQLKKIINDNEKNGP